MAKVDVPLKELKQSEARELRRVFDLLAGFSSKQRLRRLIAPALERRASIAAGRPGADDSSGAASPPAAAVDEAELRRLDEDIAVLQRRIGEVDGAPESERKIQSRDLHAALAMLGKACDKREVDDMIWEVDENLDGCVDWEEFLLMFRRNVSDTTGLEPFQLFNVVQFCMYDKDFTGFITVDQTMQMLFARFGKERLEAEIKTLFGASLNAESTSSLSFRDYTVSVSKRTPPAAAGGGVGRGGVGGGASVRIG